MRHTTQDAAAHARNLRRLVNGYVESKQMAAMIIAHADALDAARVAAEQRADAERERADRLRELFFAVDALANAVVDMLTDEQLNGPDYPSELDDRHVALARICRKHGDLDSASGDTGGGAQP